MLKTIKKRIYTRFFKEFHSKPPNPNRYADIDQHEQRIVNEVKEYTLTNPERIVSLIRAVEYIEDNSIEGSIVECGVWKGGSIMAVLKKLKEIKSLNRDIYLYDTFEGMPAPSNLDESYQGLSAAKAFESKSDFWSRIECISNLNEVQNNIYSVGYPREKIQFIEGKVEETIPNIIPNKISILRLDTDWYESTMHELEFLFPKLVSGGVIIIDDYGHWKGCKKAVDEYIKNNKIKLFLNRIDYTCRIGVKL